MSDIDDRMEAQEAEYEMGIEREREVEEFTVNGSDPADTEDARVKNENGE